MVKRSKRRVSKKWSKRSRGRQSSSRKKNDANKFHKALCVLSSMKNSDRCKALASANNNFIRKFSTAVRKLKNRNVSEKQRKRLKAYRGQLRKIANPKGSISSKRKILSQQRGGLLPIVLPLLKIFGPALAGSLLSR